MSQHKLLESADFIVDCFDISCVPSSSCDFGINFERIVHNQLILLLIVLLKAVCHQYDVIVCLDITDFESILGKKKNG